MIKSSVGEKRVYLTHRSQFVFEEVRAATHGGTEQDPWQKAAHSLSDSPLAKFFIHPRVTCAQTVLPTVDWVPLQN